MATPKFKAMAHPHTNLKRHKIDKKRKKSVSFFCQETSWKLNYKKFN